MKVVTVSGAIILRDNKIFATQRGYGDWKGWWEFPGGKLEPNETPEQCIEREIQEELATEVKAEKILGVVLAPGEIVSNLVRNFDSEKSHKSIMLR